MSDLNIYSVVTFDKDAPVMNREQIEMLLMMDDKEKSIALIRELFVIFESESQEKLIELERVCMENLLDDLRKIVHFVAGSAGNLGMARLALFYRSIEQCIDTGVLFEVSAAAKPIRSEFEAAIVAFKAEFNL